MIPKYKKNPIKNIKIKKDGRLEKPSLAENVLSIHELIIENFKLVNEIIVLSADGSMKIILPAPLSILWFQMCQIQGRHFFALHLPSW